MPLTSLGRERGVNLDGTSPSYKEEVGVIWRRVAHAQSRKKKGKKRGSVTIDNYSQVSPTPFFGVDFSGDEKGAGSGSAAHEREVDRDAIAEHLLAER